MGVLKTKAEDALGRNAPTPGSKSRGTLYNSTGEQTKMKLDNASLTFGGNALAVRKADVTEKKQKTVADAYAEHAKLVFLFDASGSMGDRVATDRNGATLTDAFIWLPERLTEIGEACASAVAKIEAYDLSTLTGTNDEDDDEGPGLTDFEKLCSKLCRENGMAEPQTPTEDEIKERIVRHDLTTEFEILPTLGKRQTPPTRMELLKRLASAEINARFKKFPGARVAVVAFGGDSYTLFDDGDASQVDAAIAQLDHDGMRFFDPATGYHRNRVESGDTNILNAISTGMEICRARPSAVGLHHFILVTDGGANGNLTSWVPNMKASGVVLDYIHIGEAHYVNDGVKAACEATGGEFMMCNTEKDIAEKFTLAASRLCLPPAPGK